MRDAARQGQGAGLHAVEASAVGRYGSSLDYAQQTLLELKRHSIHDAALARLVRLAETRLSAEADGGMPPSPLYPSRT